jgi:transcriptional regulator with XRE-family HTH domain
MPATETLKPDLQLAVRLRTLLKERGMTAAELARQSGVPKQVLSLWLGGVEPRKISHLKSVAAVFGMTIDALCFGEEASLKRNPISAPDEWIEGVFEGRIRRAIQFRKIQEE